MINKFHMNPLWFLTTIPLGVAVFKSYKLFVNSNNWILSTLIVYIALLCVLFFMYINNIIGLVDMIFLFFIMCSFANPMVPYTIYLNLILIPLAIGLSYALK